jgi:copper chaperone
LTPLLIRQKELDAFTVKQNPRHRLLGYRKSISQAPVHGHPIVSVIVIINQGDTMPAIRVKGMSCQHCVASVTKALNEIEGVSDVVVDLATGTATYNEKAPVATDTLKKAIAAIGFEVVGK